MSPHSAGALPLDDARTLREARMGNPRALATLLQPHLGTVWSVCRAMAAPEDVSMHLFDDFHHYAARAVRDEPLDVPLDRAVLRWLWAHLRQALDLPNEPLLDTPALPRPSPQGLVPPAQATERVRAAVLEAPPRWRLLYLLALLSGLGARELSEALDAPEEEVRRARMHLSTTIHRRLAQ